MGKPVRVQIPPSAPSNFFCSGLLFLKLPNISVSQMANNYGSQDPPWGWPDNVNHRIERLSIYAQSLKHSFSQESSKTSFSDIHLFPILINRTQQSDAVTFHLNDVSSKIGRAFNSTRNTRFIKTCANTEQNIDVVYATSFHNKRFQRFNRVSPFFI